MSDPTLNVSGAYRPVVEKLLARYGWTAVSDQELLDRLEGGSDDELPFTSTKDSSEAQEQVVIHHYTALLYEVCCQEQDQRRRERGYSDLYRYLYRAALNRWPDIAEDVTQRALLLTYEQAHRCKNPGAFLTFALFKLLQARKELLRLHSWEALPTSRSDQEGELQVADASEPLAEMVMRDECVRALLDSVAHLPDTQRQTIVLKFLNGLSDEEIGDRLALTANYVAVLRFRGIKKLRSNSSLREACL